MVPFVELGGSSGLHGYCTVWLATTGTCEDGARYYVCYETGSNEEGKCGDQRAVLAPLAGPYRAEDSSVSVCHRRKNRSTAVLYPFGL